MKSKNTALWGLAIACAVLGVVVLRWANGLSQQTLARTIEAHAAAQESATIKSASSSPFAFERELSALQLSPQVQRNGATVSLRFQDANANAVFAFIALAEKRGGTRVSAASVTFPSPGLVSGTVELVGK
jgi:type II secretory pathway component PulM